MAGSGSHQRGEYREAAARVGLEYRHNDLFVPFAKKAPQRLWEQRGTDPQAVGTTTLGGYLSPDLFAPSLEKALLQFSNIRNHATIIRTQSGDRMLFPTNNDTGNVSTIVGENAEHTVKDTSFDQTSIDTYVYSSGFVKVSWQLLADSAFDLPSYLGAALGERDARGTNTHFTTGDGSSKPYGVAAGATLGFATENAQIIKRDDMVGLYHNLDPAYRGNAKFMMHDSVWAQLKNIVDSQLRPLWHVNLAAGAPDTWDGKEIVINQDCATMSNNAKVVYFGDFSKFVIRDAALDGYGSGVVIRRLDERFAEFGQSAFIVLSRHGSRLLDAGTNPIVYLQAGGGS